MKNLLLSLSLVVLLAGCATVQQEDSLAYVNQTFAYSLELPVGYSAHGPDDMVSVSNDEIEFVEFWVSAYPMAEGEGRYDDAISSEEININGTAGTLVITDYGELYPDAECPHYLLSHGEYIIEFAEHECLISDIFEDVVNSFESVL